MSTQFDTRQQTGQTVMERPVMEPSEVTGACDRHPSARAQMTILLHSSGRTLSFCGHCARETLAHPPTDFFFWSLPDRHTITDHDPLLGDEQREVMDWYLP